MEKDHAGFWGPTSATIDWCEANYEVSHYVAEFWNTVSNLAMIIPPILSAALGFRDGLETHVWVSHLFLLAVGVGSWCYHATLLYEYQLLDEVPMVWGAAYLVFTLHHIDSPRGKFDKRFVVTLTSYCTFATVTYVFLKIPLFHQVAYGILTLGMAYYPVKFIRRYKDLRWLFITGISMYLLGFAVWISDNVICSTFRSYRAALGYPLKPLLQGHAWWHVLAGLGTYYSILVMIQARCRFLKRHSQVKNEFGIPVVRSWQDTP